MKKIFLVFFILISILFSKNNLDPVWQETTIINNKVRNVIIEHVGQISSSNVVYLDKKGGDDLIIYRLDKLIKENMKGKYHYEIYFFFFDKESKLLKSIDNSNLRTFYRLKKGDDILYLFDLNYDNSNRYSSGYYELLIITPTTIRSVLHLRHSYNSPIAPCYFGLFTKNHIRKDINIYFNKDLSELYTEIEVFDNGAKKKVVKEEINKLISSYNEKKVTYRWNGREYKSDFTQFKKIYKTLEHLEKQEYSY